MQAIKPGITLFLILGIFGCSPQFQPAASGVAANHIPLEYADMGNWAAHPAIRDASDSIPAPLAGNYQRDSSVDVFFVHPTSYTSKKAKEWNARLEDAELNQKTDGSSILYQASVFNEYNVFAPRYRQAHIEAYYHSDTVSAKRALMLAYEDVKSAFLHYIRNWNNGRPFIIASHSQGATHCKMLLKELVEGRELQKQLVAAYLLGMPTEPEYFRDLPPCTDSVATGCFMSWRTFRNGFEPAFKPSMRSSIVTNPLNWVVDTTYAPVALHKGAILRNFHKLYPAVNDARVHKDLLWISRPKFPGSRFYRSRNYHVGDINLFYVNLRENLRQRVMAFHYK